jgi:RNA methyltransferase, TrmH family
MEILTSLQNPRIKNVMRLQSKSRERRKQNLIVIEGLREISRAQRSGFVLQEIFIYPGLSTVKLLEESITQGRNCQIFEVSLPVFEKLAYREGSDGVIAIAEARYLKASDLVLSKRPLLLVVESVEKPGNLGAVMRTADAAGIDAVIICDPLTDLFNPNTIRSSVGCIFSVPVVTDSTEHIQVWLKEKGIHAYAAALSPKAKPYHRMDYTLPTAFVMGTESTGLSASWIGFCKEQVVIPMNGIADSLNVSVSAAILIYEAIRQRNS